MKKFALALLLVLLCAGAASATPVTGLDSWYIWVTASDNSELHSAGDLGIGWDAGYTDGIDTSHPDGTEDVPPQTNGPASVAVAESLFPGTLNHYSMSDYREPARTNHNTKVWNLRVYYIPGSFDSTGLDPIKVSVSQGGPDYDYSFGPIHVSCPQAYGTNNWVFTSAHQWQDFEFTVPGNTVGNSVAMTVVCGNVVPEPSSLLALGSGLLGLAGFCIRRRR